MNLTRQQRRAICRKMAKDALKALPMRENRKEHRKSVKLLAKRMYAEVSPEVEVPKPDGPVGQTLEFRFDEHGRLYGPGKIVQPSGLVLR